MSIIIRLQNLPWTANSVDIRRYFSGLSIPEGGVHIVGGEKGDAFIAFSTDEDARQAMERDGGKIKEMKVKLLLSSRAEMTRVIEQARNQTSSIQTASVIKAAANDSDRRKIRDRSPSPNRSRKDREKSPPRDRRKTSYSKRDRSRSRSRSPSRRTADRDRDVDRRSDRSKRDERSRYDERDPRYKSSRDYNTRESNSQDRKSEIGNKIRSEPIQNKSFDPQMGATPQTFDSMHLDGGGLRTRSMEFNPRQGNLPDNSASFHDPRNQATSASTSSSYTFPAAVNIAPIKQEIKKEPMAPTAFPDLDKFSSLFDNVQPLKARTSGNYETKRPSPTPAALAPKVESNQPYTKGYGMSSRADPYNLTGSNFGNCPDPTASTYGTGQTAEKGAIPAVPHDKKNVLSSKPVYGAEPHARYEQIPEANQASKSSTAPVPANDSGPFNKRLSSMSSAGAMTTMPPNNKPRRSRFEPEVSTSEEIPYSKVTSDPRTASAAYSARQTDANNHPRQGDNPSRENLSRKDPSWLGQPSEGSSSQRPALLSPPQRSGDFPDIDAMDIDNDDDDDGKNVKNMPPSNRGIGHPVRREIQNHDPRSQNVPGYFQKNSDRPINPSLEERNQSRARANIQSRDSQPPLNEPRHGPLLNESMYGPPSNEPRHGSSVNESRYGPPSNEPRHGSSVNESRYGPPPNEPRHGSSVNESRYGPPSNEPRHGSSVNESRRIPPLNEPRHGSAINEPRHGPPMNEHRHGPPLNERHGPPRHGSPLKDPRHGSPLGDPRHGSAINEPRHGSSINEPRHGSSINEARHGLPINEPRHGSSVNDPRHGLSLNKGEGLHMGSRNEGPLKRDLSSLTVIVNDLPYDVTENDILGLFRGIFISPENLKLTHDNHGIPSAYVRFVNPRDHNEALSRSRQKNIAGSYPEIIPCSLKEFETAPVFNVHSRMESVGPPPQNSRRQAHRAQEEDLCVKLESLPASCIEDDIVHFFDGLGILDIIIQENVDNRGSKIGYVEFGMPADFHAALNLTGKMIGHRYIAVTITSRAVMNLAQKNKRIKKEPLFLAPSRDSAPPRIPNKSRPSPHDGPMYCVAINGLPEIVENRHIADFFAEDRLCPRAIHIMLNSNKLPSGDAFVEFTTIDEFEIALQRNGKYLAGCRVSLNPITYQEMADILGPSSAPAPLLRNPPEDRPTRRPLMPMPPPRDEDVSFRERERRLLDDTSPDNFGPPNRQRAEPRYPLNDMPFDHSGSVSTRPPFGRMRAPVPSRPGNRPQRPPLFGSDGPRFISDGPPSSHFGGDGPPQRFRPTGSQRGPLIPQNNGPNDFGMPGCVVAINNLHFRAGLDEIMDAFQGFLLDKDKILRKYNDKGQATGEARIAFRCREDAARAVEELNQKVIFGRPIYLSLV